MNKELIEYYEFGRLYISIVLIPNLQEIVLNVEKSVYLSRNK